MSDVSDPGSQDLRSQNSRILPLELILIRVVSRLLLKSEVDWIELGSRGPYEQGDSCNMGLNVEPKGR